MIRKSKYSRKLSLKIEYHYKNNNSPNIGTGFFIKGQDSQVYLVTAKHNFSERDRRENDKWKDVKLKELTKNLTSRVIVEKNNQKICDVHSIAFHHEDLIVFNVSLFGDEVENIKILYKEEYTEPNFFFYGFCKKKFQENLTSPTESDNPYLYTVQDTQSNSINAIKGCSGGGVFIEEDGEFYLVGMLLQRYDAGASFTVFNFPKYLKENPQEGFDVFNQIGLEDTQKNVSLIDEVSEKESHIIPGDGYIEPRTVYIEELDIHVAVCPVTFEEYDLFCEDIGIDKPDDEEWGRDNRPVVNVTWDDANLYCQWLRKITGINYRLPSLDEWEAIAKLNCQNHNLINYISCKENTKKKTAVVGSKEQGLLGLYDMPGNIYEWSNTIKNESIIVKGASFRNKLNSFSLEKFIFVLPFDSNDNLGFRIVV